MLPSKSSTALCNLNKLIKTFVFLYIRLRQISTRHKTRKKKKQKTQNKKKFEKYAGAARVMDTEGQVNVY